jgi:hypothetical protein
VQLGVVVTVDIPKELVGKGRALGDVEGNPSKRDP